jgi:hypothetical protein
MDIVVEIRDDHQEWNGDEEAICCHCEGSWPCSAERAAREIERLRKGIQDYLDGDYEPKITKMDKCQHGLYGYEHCENCSDEHFARVLADGQLGKDGEP